MLINLQAAHAPVLRPNRSALNYHPFNCHMAAIYWGLKASGQLDTAAEDLVENLTRATCPHCAGTNDLIASLQNDVYGRMFCANAVPLLPVECQAGDIAIYASKAIPVHSMVVVNVNNGVFVRGFNNAGTFAGSPRGAFDPLEHNIAGRLRPMDMTLFRIPEATFLNEVGKIPTLVRNWKRFHHVTTRRNINYV